MPDLRLAIPAAALWAATALAVGFPAAGWAAGWMGVAAGLAAVLCVACTVLIGTGRRPRLRGALVLCAVAAAA